MQLEGGFFTAALTARCRPLGLLFMTVLYVLYLAYIDNDRNDSWPHRSLQQSAHICS